MHAIEKRREALGQGGFTLIELLVVIAILGILAGVVVFAVGNATDSAQENACKIELREIQTAAEAYKGLGGTGDYPAAMGDMVGGGNASFLQELPDGHDFTNNGDGTATIGELADCVGTGTTATIGA